MSTYLHMNRQVWSEIGYPDLTPQQKYKLSKLHEQLHSQPMLRYTLYRNDDRGVVVFIHAMVGVYGTTIDHTRSLGSK